ncbi:MAG TPA: FG-GAP-like repeat-containing protein [Acidobacteriaceae bacterium]|jgi:Tfp pilus assembly protein PilF|nr:FG-GAP-like repeat-containing protein [Acidobacteriaceae bacterium]
MPTLFSSIGRSAPVAALAAAALLTAGCHSDLPRPDSAKYQQFVQAFYVGLAAMQVGNDARAEDSLHQATQLAPGEPAAWADWGLLALRQRNYDSAKQRLDRAQSLASKNGRIDYMLGILESDRGNSAAAIGDFRTAVAITPHNPRVQYSLALEIERQGGPDSEQQFQQIIQEILEEHPNNVAALLELSRIAAKRGDAATLHSAVDRIAGHAGNWPADVRQRLADLQAVAASGSPQTAGTRSIFLRNVLMQLPGFRQQLGILRAEPGEEAPPFAAFLRLTTPRSQPAPADTEISFQPEPLADLAHQAWDWIGAVSLDDTHAPVVITANAKTVQMAGGPSFPFPGGTRSVAPGPESILPIDFNYDFKTDLVLAGAGGLRFLRQDASSSSPQFTDVTAQAKLPAPIANGVWTGAWAVDIEADGDLDIVLGAAAGPPNVLRNNGDGTFTPIHPFAGVTGVQQFVWADLEGDGNPDASLIDGAGNLHLFRNERAGGFREETLPFDPGRIRAIAVADTRHSGILDLLAVRTDGAIIRLQNDNGAWSSSEVAQVPDTGITLNRDIRLLTGDLDNNGAVDLMVAPVSPLRAMFPFRAPGGATDYKNGALIWLAGEDGAYTLLDRPCGPNRVFEAADVNHTGHLDLLGLDADGHPVRAVNHGTKNYHWQVIRTRAVQATGDQRINSFGVGGAVELRSGMLLQAQSITGPEEHFGLGTWTETDVARILWPNGTVNAEFQLHADQEILTQQRLKGSCPFLFAWNGKKMAFVKDTVPWGSAIGLRINALGSARIAATQEWYKIPRNDLVPRAGAYDLRITGELWETYYYDWLQMMTVDHPAGTEVFTDERFVVPPVKLAITATEIPHPIARAIDDNGDDVTDILRSLDGRYLDNFGRGQYQGITRDHFVEIDLGEDAPSGGPLYLIARGWVHPSDSSINVALSQGRHQQPHPLSLEVPDGRGRWVVARENLGFPAGRNKICLIDLTGVFRPGTPRKLRLRTDLEVYWDQMQWARGLPNTPLTITHIAPSSADLHYRGYSTIHQANASSPEIPDYNQIAATTQIWRDLEGFYTRYGDVRELLGKVDDRYVIMNAGDEMALRFPAPAPPRVGWVRDYVLAGDGWIKDGDYNSTDSATVQPLPYHAKTAYDDPPVPLTDEWVYQHHPEDWLTWQTRYVTPEPFRNALNGSPTPNPLPSRQAVPSR